LRGFAVVRACRSYDPEFFFPIGKTGRAIAEIQRAKAVCAACPVRAECLAFALETHQDYGIWGDCDDDERRALRRPAAPGHLTTADTGRRGGKLARSVLKAA
jgi:WhiB family transcriptional regulator, redox-sensing transcriptional regulator